MAITITDFTPRDMLRLLEQMPRPTNFLQTMFVKEKNTTNKTVLDIDKIYGKQLIARYSDRDGDMNQVGKDGFETLTFIAPYVTEKIAIKPSDVDIRLAGETVYSDPAMFLSRFVERSLADLEARFDRLEELQLAQALQEGVVTVQGKDVDREIDFEQDATHLVDAGTVDWSDTDADIIGDCSDYCQLVEDTGAPACDVLILGRSAANAFRQNTGILANLDNRRVNTGEINYRQLVDQRATYLGRLAGIGFDLEVYSYHGIYEYISSGTRTSAPYIDKWNAIFGSRAADIRMHYAKIENFKAGDFIGTRLPNQWETQDGKSRFISMESSPMIGFHQTNSFVRVTVGAD